MEGINVDQLTQGALHDLNSKLGHLMGGDCIFINSRLLPPIDGELRVVIEDI